MALYEMYEVTNDYFMIKFDSTIRASTLINANFVVIPESTGVPIPTAFKTIDLARDYKSVSRSLFLWWNITLQAGESYTVRAQNLVATTGMTHATEDIVFEVEGDATPPPPDEDYRDTRVPVEVKDFSIKTLPTLNGGGSGGGPGTPGTAFGIKKITPSLHESFHLTDDAFDGKIIVEFNDTPAANFVNNEDFKLQRKRTSGISHWENVNTVVVSEANSNKVKIYLPSNEEPSIYSFQVEREPTRQYWESGYQYRLTISDSVGT